MVICNTKKGQALIYEGLVILITIIIITFLLYLLHSKITSLKSEINLEKPKIGCLESIEFTNIYLNYPIPKTIKKEYNLNNNTRTIKDLIQAQSKLHNNFNTILQKVTTNFIKEMQNKGFNITSSNIITSPTPIQAQNSLPIPYLHNNILSFYYIKINPNENE